MRDHMARALRIASTVAQRAGRAAVNAAMPPTCLVSDAPVEAPGRISPAAWAALTFIADPACARCGVPFGFDPESPEAPKAPDLSAPGGAEQGAPETGSWCAACTAAPPVVTAARSVLVYDAASKPLVLALKHAGRSDGVATFADWMLQRTPDAARRGARVAPVPLHPSRLRARRFNQAALLARALAERLDQPFDPDTLARARATPSQAGHSASGRARNVAGAFQVRDPASVKGAHIVLVDDVHTTGATLDACARTLIRAGAARVDAVTLARVVRPRDALI